MDLFLHFGLIAGGATHFYDHRIHLVISSYIYILSRELFLFIFANLFTHYLQSASNENNVLFFKWCRDSIFLQDLHTVIVDKFVSLPEVKPDFG